MRKALILLCLLSMLSAGSLTAAHTLFSRNTEEVSYRQEVLFGDPAAAEGLTIGLRSALDRRLWWDTTLTPLAEASSQFTYSPTRLPQEATGWSNSLDLYTGFYMGMSSNANINFNEETRISWLAQPLEELARETAPDSTGTKLVSVSDYVNYYPLQADIRLNGNGYYWDDFQHQTYHGIPVEEFQLIRDLAEAFSFPVVPGHRLELTIETDSLGNVVTLNIGSVVGGPSPSVYCRSFASQQDLYFVVDAQANQEDDTLLDYSHTPGGYGVYHLPGDRPGVTIEDLTLFAPLSPNSRVRDGFVDEATGRLVLLVTEGNAVRLIAYDPDTAQPVQTIPLDITGEHWPNLYVRNGLLLVQQDPTRGQLLTRTDSGDYVSRFSFTLPECGMTLDDLLSSNYIDLAYDGQRLALCCQKWIVTPDGYRHTPPNSSVALAIVDHTGLLYAGSYTGSLDQETLTYNSSRDCRLEDPGITLRWD